MQTSLQALTGPARRWLMPLLWLALAAGLGAAEPATKEFQLKAVFLFNFVQFVQWPAQAFATPDAPVVIGVWGEDPFGGSLEEAVHGETVRGRAIVVRPVRSVGEAAGCHVLFVAGSERGTVDRLLAELGSRPVLTVSDLPNFARRGGVVAFYFDGPKLRFEIDPTIAQRNGLQLSSQLLNLARIAPGAARNSG